MNRIKHYLILALALAMSLGAWAQGQLLTTINASSDFTSGSKTFDNVATVTFEEEVSCTDYAGWYTNGSPISVTVAPVDGVTITSVKFFIGDNSPEDTQAPFTATLDIEYGMATKTQVNDTYYDGGLKKIEVYGYEAPEVERTAQGNWVFAMPAGNRALKIDLKAEPALAWTFGGRAIPNDTTLSAFFGFHLPVIAQIGNTADADFLAAPGVTLRYGSTDPAVISFTDANDMQSFSVNGAGECDVYMVFDGDNDFQYDSVAFHAVLAAPDTLTLAANDDTWGSVTIEGAGGAGGEVTIGDSTSTTTNDYIPGYSLFEYAYSQQIYTADEIGLSGDITSLTMWLKNNSSFPRNLQVYMKEVDRSAFASNSDWEPLTSDNLVATGTMNNAFNAPVNYTFNLTTPFHYSGTGNLLLCIRDTTGSWSSGLGGVTMEVDTNQAIYVYRDGTPFDISNPGLGAGGNLLQKKNVVKFHIESGAGSNSIVVLDEAAGTYAVIPGTEVTVVATPTDTTYLVNFDNDEALNSNVVVNNTFVVTADTTLTANFSLKPTLTLVANPTDGGEMEVMPAGGPVWGDSENNFAPTLPYTADGITLSTEGEAIIYGSGYSWTDTWRSNSSSDKFVFTNESGNFSRIEMTLSGNFPKEWGEGWTVNGDQAVWEGNANRVEIVNCTTYVRQITFSGSGAVTVRPVANTTNQYYVDYGTDVTVKANANQGYHMANWSNNAVVNSLTEATQTLTVTSDLNLTATFAQNPLLTLNANEGGTVTLDGMTPGEVTYNIEIEGGNTYTNVTFPFTTTVFLQEGLDEVYDDELSPLSIDQQVGNNVVITISAPYDGTRTIQYGCGAGEGGAKAIFCTGVQGNPIMPEGVTYAGYDTYLVLPGTTVNVTATPDSAHYFQNWTGEADAISNQAVTKTLTMGQEDVDLIANFHAKPTLTLAHNDGGTLEAIVPQGEPVLLTTIYPTSNALITGSQTNDTVTVTLEGDLMWGDGGWIVQYGDGYYGSVSVTAAAGFDIAYYKFYSSYGDSYIDSVAPYAVYPYFHTETSGQYIYSQIYGQGQFIGTGAVTRIEVYTTTTANVTPIANTTNQYYVDYGTDVTVKANANQGYHMANWSNNAVVNSLTEATQTLTVTSDLDLTATFAQNPLLTLAANDTTWGKVTVEGAGEETLLTTIVNTGDNTNFTSGSKTFDNIATVTFSSEVANYGDSWGWNHVNGITLTVTPVEGITITRVKFTCAEGSAFDSIAPFEAVLGEGAPWYNSYMFVNGTSYGEFGVTKIEVYGYAGNPAITQLTDTTYRVLPGTEVTVVATPTDTTYLVNFDNDEALNSNVAAEKTYTVTENTTATANFSLKPTLTLVANPTEGGEMEIVPAGGVTAMHLTTDQISTWSGVAEPAREADLQPFGFVAVDSAAAAAWTGAPASGEAHLLYAPAGDHFKAHVFRNGQWSEAYTADYLKGNIYLFSDLIYFTTGASTANVIASATPNTYYIDYGTDVTVVATPSDTTYLVNFDNDEALNSNVAAEKTYTVTENTTATAYFAAKPTLTLAANDDTWGSVTIEGAGSAAGGEVTIGDGTTTAYYHTPYNSLWGYSFVESLYTDEEIGTAGTITSISYNLKEDNEPQTSNFVIYMKNVSRSTFASETPDYEPVTDADIVYSGSVTFNPGWTTITLDTPFEYDGTSNLMIALDENTDGYGTRYFYYTDNADKVVTYHSDTYNPDPYNLGSYQGNRYTSSKRANIKLDITAAGSGLSAGVEQLTENTYRVDYGAELVVKAVPESRCFDFTEWSDGTEVNEYLTDTLTITEDYTLTATFTRHDYVGDTTASVCDQFTWHDSTYTVTPETAPTFLYYTTDECDSTVTLNLTIRHQNTGIDNQNVCDSLQWIDGLTYYEANDTAVFTLEGANIEGCDSVVTLNLIIRHSDTSSFRAQANVSYEWLNETFTADGVYTRVLTNTAGCDSTVTMTLAIMPPTTPIPNIYSLMDVMLMINHNPDSLDNFVEYVWYRWYRNGVLVKEGADADSYDEAGQILDGCYYLEVCTDLTQNYWVRSNELCFGTEGIADVERVNFRIAPNPANRGQRVVVAVEGAEGNLQGAHLAIFDAQGRMIANTEFNSSTVELSQSQFSTGIYMLRLTLRDGRTATRRLVVR